MVGHISGNISRESGHVFTAYPQLSVRNKKRKKNAIWGEIEGGVGIGSWDRELGSGVGRWGGGSVEILRVGAGVGSWGGRWVRSWELSWELGSELGVKILGDGGKLGVNWE